MDLRTLVKRRIDALKQSMQDALTSGGASDFAEYQKMIGKYQGLTDAYNEIEGLLGDDEEEEPGR